MGWTEYEPIAASTGCRSSSPDSSRSTSSKACCWPCASSRRGRYEVENQYARACAGTAISPRRTSSRAVFELVDRNWRGIGGIPRSGLCVREEFAAFDSDTGALRSPGSNTAEPTVCRAGDVLRGVLKPTECPAFGTLCTPERPLGAPMVSSEGACAAYYNYGRSGAPL